jgi:MinD superfamily P-loop ATPase
MPNADDVRRQSGSQRALRIAVASGKGGTGKTTIAAALARIAARRGLDAVYVDCDVEAPNGGLLLKPDIESRRPVERLIPQVDAALCERCGACQDACQFGAIISTPASVQVFEKLCKSCGACIAACPQRAIGERSVAVGRVETGRSGPLRFVQGVLDVGQPRSIPVIEAAMAAAGDADLVVLDAPPGASCPVVATIRDADLVLLIAEPTPFGMADLEIAAETVRILGRPAAAAINRLPPGSASPADIIEARGAPVLAEFPQLRAVAEAYAEGDLDGVIEHLDETLEHLLDRVLARSARRAS